MFCPFCQHQDHLEIDLHSDGFSSGTLLECTTCGALLNLNRETLSTIHPPLSTAARETAPGTR